MDRRLHGRYHALTAFVCLTQCLVIQGIETPTPRNLLLLGAVCGLGVLLKPTFPVYVALLIIYLLTRLASESRLSFAAFGALAASGDPAASSVVHIKFPDGHRTGHSERIL